MTHSITLGYTNSDDGIWLWCTCGWQLNLGYEPDPHDAVDHADAHLRETQ